VNDSDGPDGAMSPKEAAANGILLLVAGHDSTVNTISNCVMTFLRNLGTLERLRDKPELIPRAIEEVQRLQSAVQFFPSYSATADIEIAGTVIPKGCAVHLMYSAANRDPRTIHEPEPIRPRTAPTMSTSAGAAAYMSASAGHSPAWRSTSRWRTSCDEWRIHCWSSTRRRTVRARSSAVPPTF